MRSLSLFLILTFCCWTASTASTNCSTLTTCSGCYADSTNCGWCTLHGTCEDASTTSCPAQYWNYNTSTVLSFSTQPSDTEMTPDSYSLYLRAGVPITISTVITASSSNPVDVYFLVEMSTNMNSIVSNVATLISSLTTKLGLISTNVRVGLGTFVDKPVSPFAVSSAYVFQNAIPLSNNLGSVSSQISTFISSSNVVQTYSSPQAGLEALLQVVACTSEINWRITSATRRIIMYISASDFHLAGDALLGGISSPHPGTCLLSGGTYNSVAYDYPSISQVKNALLDTGIIPIFLIQSDASNSNLQYFGNSYTGFINYLGATAYFANLTTDLNSAVNLFEDAYNQMSTVVTPALVSTGANLVNITFNATTQTIPLSSQGTFQLTVSWDGTTSISGSGVEVSFGSYGKLSISLQSEFTCNCGAAPCNCPNNSACDCGTCVCNSGYSGSNCTCNLNASPQDTFSPLCSEVGTWYVTCQVCICDAGYYGAACQCPEFCPNNCSGLGTCECGVCDCYSGYAGYECDCQDECPGNCNNAGVCNCGICDCEPGLTGAACDICTPNSLNPLCLGSTADSNLLTCKTLSSCGGCLNTTGCTWCPSVDTCYPSSLANSSCPLIWTSCLVQTTSTIAISVGAATGGVFAAGVLLLVLYKAQITVRDKRAWKKFNKKVEASKANMINQRNPAFRQESQEMLNPTYSKH